MTDLDRMILAARQIGEVVGEDLLADLTIGCSVIFLSGPSENCVEIYESQALDLLTARVWRAVMKWAYHVSWCSKSGFLIQYQPLCMYIGKMPRDLPDAVAAIYEFWKEHLRGK